MSPIPAPPFLGLPKLLSTFLEQEACKAVERAKKCPVRKCSVPTDFHVKHRSHARLPALQSPANHRGSLYQERLLSQSWRRVIRYQ